MAFRVGQEVECILDGDWYFSGPERDGEPPTTGPKNGDVLRVHAIDLRDGDVCLQFAEWDGVYVATNFRPLIRTDISIFLAMLNAKPKRVQKPAKVTT